MAIRRRAKARKFNWLPNTNWGLTFNVTSAAGAWGTRSNTSEFQLTRGNQTKDPVSISEYTIFRIVGDILVSGNLTAGPNGAVGLLALGLYVGVDGQQPSLDPAQLVADAEYDNWIWLWHDIMVPQALQTGNQTNPRMRIPVDIKRRVKLKAGMAVILAAQTFNAVMPVYPFLRALITNID